MLNSFNPPRSIRHLTRDDSNAFAPPPAFGPFRVLHQVGVGALGPVFRTYEPTQDRLVAVKVFRLDITPEQAQALADELGMAAKSGLFHPSIVEPIAAGVQGSVAYRAEEYVAAESLDVAMRHYAPATTDKVLPFISQLAAALDFARMHGVGHGALHPRDIFVTPEEARATGFGVVEALERVGLRAPVRRPYSAPERVAGGKWSTAADVFSLGAITYELLTGRRPAGVGAAIGDLSGTSLPHTDLVHSVLVRSMEENPASRFPTAMAFATALESATHGEAFAPAGASAKAATAQAKPAPPAPVVPVDLSEWTDPKAPALSERSESNGFEIDDIAAEREEDAAFFDLAREESVGDDEHALPRGRNLFDIEAVEDLALEPEPHRFQDDFDPVVLEEPARRAEPLPRAEPAMRAQPGRIFNAEEEDDAYVPPPRRTIDYAAEDKYEEEPPRHRFRPLALMLMLGVIVGVGIGMAMGYGIWGAGAAPTATEEKAESAEPKPDEPPQPKPQAGKQYSEGTVTPQEKPPAQAPPVPGDAPAPAPAPTAATPQTPAPASSGRLIVRSSPANAGVTLNGTWRGRTPLTLDKLRLGTHEVRVVQPGFNVASQSINLTPNAPARTLSFRLQQSDAAAGAEPPAAVPPAPVSRPAERPEAPPAAPEPKGPGSLYVDSRPRGAAIFVDGRKVGVTPATIPDVTPGPHVVRLELPDHRPWTANSQVLAGQQTRVTGSLERVR